MSMSFYKQLKNIQINNGGQVELKKGLSEEQYDIINKLKKLRGRKMFLEGKRDELRKDGMKYPLVRVTQFQKANQVGQEIVTISERIDALQKTLNNALK